MRQHHDPIPMLPPMPLPRRRQRRSYAPFVAAILLGVIGLVIGVAFVIKHRYEQVANEAFQRAEELFDDGAFTKAERAYQLFRREHAKDHRVAQAVVREELSQLAQSLNAESLPPGQVIESLDRFWSAQSNDKTVAERWQVILALVERRARSSLERANRSLAATDLEMAGVWLDWLRGERAARVVGSDSVAIGDLETLARQAEERIAVDSRKRGFIEAAERAIAGGTVADFAEAFRLHERARAGSAKLDPALAEPYEKLRQALRAQVRFTAPSAAADLPAGAVPRLPIEAYTRLSTREQFRTVSLKTTDPVFARVKDLCFALDPASGSPRWVLRVGYDAGLPQMVGNRVRPAVLVPWFRGPDTLLSLCDAASSETIWSWRSPDVLSGPPAITRDSVFVTTTGGAVWQLDLERGTPRSVAELPEAIDAAPAARMDDRGLCAGLCVVGARQAVYLFDFTRDTPECSDVVLTGRRSDTSQCQAMWVPPYVVVFENDLMNRCYVRVLFQDASGHRPVRQDMELDGRVWQPPVLDGPDIFLVTDRGTKYWVGLDPGNSAVNMYTVASSPQTPPPGRPIRPCFARVGDLPFVSLSDAVVGYRPDRSKGLLLQSWSRRPPHPQAVAVQPLQVAGGVIVAGWQQPDRDGLLVQALGALGGEPIWETRLGAAARDLATVGHETNNPLIVARTDAAGLFVLDRDPASETWRSRLLPLPTPVSPVWCSDDASELVYASDAGTRIQRLTARDWTAQQPLVQQPAISSELAVFDGPLAVSGEAPAQPELGRWAIFVTNDRRIELRETSKVSHEIKGVRIPAAPSGSEPWRWRPLVQSSRGEPGGARRAIEGVIVAHPAGVVCRAIVRRTEEISHLFVTECRSDLTPLAAPPAPLGELALCVTRDGNCVLIDPETLRTISSWRASKAVSGVVASADRALLLLEGSTVQALRLDDGKLVPEWQRELPGTGWSLVRVQPSVLVAFDSTGRIVALDQASGQAVWTHEAPAPLAVPPQWSGDELILATIDGGVFFVPAPAGQAESRVEGRESRAR